MPELPEVETVRVQLWKKLKGKTIKKVEILNPKSVNNDQHFSEKITGLTIKNIDRIGKLLIFSFVDQPDLFMLGHLKMTGQFFVVNNKNIVVQGGHGTPHDHTLPNRHTRVIITFNDDTVLYFNDQRIFGYLLLTDKSGKDNAKKKFGPEPLSDKLDFETFFGRLMRSQQNIKARLLDQTFLAGLGNIYVDETLFRAKILPTRPANTLNKGEVKKILSEAKKVLEEAIADGGTTFQTFKDSNGAKGNYTQKLRVFGRQGKPCLKCKDIIQKTRVAGRGTHFCPNCQK